MAIAASLVTAIGVGWVLIAPTADRQPVAEVRPSTKRAPLTVSRIVHLASVRGTAGSPDIEISRADAPGELLIQPEVVVLTCEDGAIEFECPGGNAPATPQYSEYEADLVDRSRARLAWRSPRETPVGGTQLTFVVRDPGSFTAGDYDLIVRGHAADHEEVVARFVLRVN
jgi:hypothetical protein